MATFSISIVSWIPVVASIRCMIITDVIPVQPAVVIVERVVLCSSIRIRRAVFPNVDIRAKVEAKTTRDIITNTVWWVDTTVEGKELYILLLLDNELLVSQFAS